MSKELTQAVAGKRIAWLMAILTAVAMFAVVVQSAQRAYAAAPVIVSVAVAPGATVPGAVNQTYTVTFTSTAGTLNTAVVTFNAAYTGLLPATPLVTALTNGAGAACAGGGTAATVGLVVTVTYTGGCVDPGGVAASIGLAGGITNPVAGQYTASLQTNVDNPAKVSNPYIIGFGQTITQTSANVSLAGVVASPGLQTTTWTNTTLQTTTAAAGSIGINWIIPLGQTITGLVQGPSTSGVLLVGCPAFPWVGPGAFACFNGAGATAAPGSNIVVALTETIAPQGAFTTLADCTQSLITVPFGGLIVTPVCPLPVGSAVSAVTVGAATTTQSLAVTPASVSVAQTGVVGSPVPPLPTGGLQQITWTNTSNQTVPAAAGSLTLNFVIPAGQTITAFGTGGTSGMTPFCGLMPITGPNTVSCIWAGGSAAPGSTVIVAFNETITAQATPTLLTDTLSATAVFPSGGATPATPVTGTVQVGILPPIIGFAAASTNTGAVTNYTITFTAAAGALTTATAVFPAAYAGLIPANPVVTGTGDAACLGMTAATVGTTVNIAYAAGGCPNAGGAGRTVVIAGITNPAPGTYAKATFAFGTNVNPAAASNVADVVISALLPGAPTIGTATPVNGGATVSFTAPASNGGSAITSYTVTCGPAGGTATGATSPLTVNGLTNGTAYTCTVAATNAIGTGPASAASNSVTPVGPATKPVNPVGGFVPGATTKIMCFVYQGPVVASATFGGVTPNAADVFAPGIDTMTTQLGDGTFRLWSRLAGASPAFSLTGGVSFICVSGPGAVASPVFN